MHFKRCVYCGKILNREKRIGRFCSQKCSDKHDKKFREIHYEWDKIMENDAIAKRNANDKERLKRRGIF